MINEELRDLLEKEEKETVSDAFGGEKSNSKRSFSVTKIRDLVLSKEYSQDNSPLGRALYQAQNELPKDVLKVVVANLIRFSFLIELTNLKVGSTKMKTRWLPGKILKPQDGSFEPVQGDFSPGDDPRASTYENCVEIFIQCLNEITNRYKEDDSTGSLVRSFDKCSSVPYEFFFDYIDPALDPVHTCNNVEWVYNNDAKWLLQARPLIKDVLDNKLHNKIKTKTYKTDRALTGKDKTNRAKRWEVLADDFQHASLADCWSVEKELYAELVCFKNFPVEVKQKFEELSLIDPNQPICRCPVTYEELDFDVLNNDPKHGKSEYQVGHKTPLKRGGRHHGDNVCWQSANGNRIQGDMTIAETHELLESIVRRKKELFE